MMKRALNNLKKQDYFFGLLITIAFIIILAIFSPYFLKENNLDSLQTTIAPNAIVAIGMMLLIILGMFDLSVGSVMGMSGIVTGYVLSRTELVQSWGDPMVILVAVLAGLAVGLIVGFINGALVAWAKIVPLITTIGTLYIVRGMAEMIMTGDEGYSIIGFPQAFLDFGSVKFLGLYMMTWICIILLVGTGLILKKTHIGRALYYIGGNPGSAVSLGFHVKKITIMSFIVCGVLASIAGILSVARYESASRYLGVDLQLDVLIACIIGGGSLLGGKGDMWGAFFGTAFVTLLQNGFNLFEINPLLKSVVIGAILVLVVAIDGYIYLKKMRALGKA